jgi:hypothetical protein
MPWRAYDVQTTENRITGVDIFSVSDGNAKRLYADIFIDYTGDGWIGYWAAAEYRYGRESKTEFGDERTQYGRLWSPTTPDNKVMGASLLWYSSVGQTASAFSDVP